MPKPISGDDHAFPATRPPVFDNQTGEWFSPRPGITIRLYLIAHAPAEPQAWFRPKVDPVALEKRPVPKDMTVEERQDFDGWADGYVDAKSAQTERMREFILARQEEKRAMREKTAEWERQRYIQWPAAWADAQLAHLGAAS